MFYEKLAEAKQKKKDTRRLPRSVSGAVAAAALTSAGTGLSDFSTNQAALGLMNLAEKNDPLLSKTQARDLIKNEVAAIIDTDDVMNVQDEKLRKRLMKGFGIVKGSKDGHVRELGGPSYMRNMGDEARRNTATRGFIYIPNKGVSEGILMHELGHATGQGKGKVGDFWGQVKRYGGKADKLRFVGSLANVASSQLAGTEEELNKAEKRNKNIALLGAALNAPTLVGEARANLRAIGLGRKLGLKNINKKALAAAYGTYLASAGARVLTPYLINKALINHRRDILRRRSERERKG